MGTKLQSTCADLEPQEKAIAKRILNRDEIGKGNFGEKVIANILLASGVRYIPLAKLDNGGAPMIEAKEGKIVLPDFDCAGEDWIAFIEAKFKTQVVRWRMQNQLRHGIDRKNYRAYVQASELFQKRCMVVLIECYDEDGQKWTGRLLAETLRDLGPPVDGMSNQSHMVYWKAKAFRDLDYFIPSELEAIHRGQTVPSYRHEFWEMMHKRKQLGLFE